MYRSIGASSRWVLSFVQLEDVQRGREAPTLLISGTYVTARRHHPLMMLSLGGSGVRILLTGYEKSKSLQFKSW